MSNLPRRDDPHPRDSLLTFSDLPKRRTSGKTITKTPTKMPVLANPPRVTPTPIPLTKRQAAIASAHKKVKRTTAPEQSSGDSPGRARGRPRATIAKGMSPNVMRKIFKKLDNSLDRVEKSMHVASIISNLQIALDALDPDVVNCWHFSRLDRRTRTLADIGENAVSLVNSYPSTAAERTTLRQYLCQSMKRRIYSKCIAKEE